MKFKTYNLDCRDVMDMFLPDNSVDSIVTDPPYGLSFMGREWDHGVPGVEFWERAFRVLKPGGHLLAFGGPRTYHRLTCAIEDAGFEIRDSVMWVFGSGFPKSLDVSKAIDKAAGAEREVVGTYARPDGTNREYENWEAKVNTAAYGDYATDRTVTAPSTKLAKQWDGWGTALKPAYEPVVVARKPLIGTVVQNVLAHGVGGLNIDGCRVPTADNLNGGAYSNGSKDLADATSYATGVNAGEFVQPEGRWPANLIHDGSAEVVALFPDSKATKTAATDNRISNGGSMFIDGVHNPENSYSDSGSAARFFYVPKASKKDRNEGCENLPTQPTYTEANPQPDRDNREQRQRANFHPTVKPTDLMRYLCRLVTPPGGTVLDPFCGSGSTLKAALLEGFNCIGIEKEEEYSKISQARCVHVLDGMNRKDKPS